MFSSLYHYDISCIDLQQDDFQKLQTFKIIDKLILTLSHYFMLSSSPKQNPLKTILLHYQKCKKKLEMDHNTFRLIMLNMLLANIYSEFDLVKASIATNLKTLEILKPHMGINKWIKSLHFNLTWSYMLIHDYQSAIEHALLCKEDYNNRAIYFMLAFQLNDPYDAKNNYG